MHEEGITGRAAKAATRADDACKEVQAIERELAEHREAAAADIAEEETAAQSPDGGGEDKKKPKS